MDENASHSPAIDAPSEQDINSAMAVYLGPQSADPRRRDAKRRLVDAVRRLVTAAALVDVAGADSEDLQAVVRDGEQLAERIESFASLGSLCAPRSGSREDSALFERSPLCGRSNPLAPAMSMHRTGDGVAGQVRYGAPYEGPAGCVHGGWVIAVFDDLLAFAMSTGGSLAPTGTLSVRLSAPTPLHEPIRLEAGIAGTDGRKTTCWGRSWSGPTLLASASAVFIGAPPVR